MQRRHRNSSATKSRSFITNPIVTSVGLIQGIWWGYIWKVLAVTQPPSRKICTTTSPTTTSMPALRQALSRLLLPSISRAQLVPAGFTTSPARHLSSTSRRQDWYTPPPIVHESVSGGWHSCMFIPSSATVYTTQYQTNSPCHKLDDIFSRLLKAKFHNPPLIAFLFPQHTYTYKSITHAHFSHPSSFFSTKLMPNSHSRSALSA